MKKRIRATEQYFTYNVSCSFDFQFTFTGQEVEPAEEGDETDFDPTEEALSALAAEIKEHLSQNYAAIENVEAFADFNDLLGISEDGKGATKVLQKIKEKQLTKPVRFKVLRSDAKSSAKRRGQCQK